MVQKLKKKTVKELSEDLIILEKIFEENEKLVKHLIDKLNKMENQLKEDNCYKNKENGISQKENMSKTYSCKVCDYVFEGKENFKVHMQEVHKRTFECRVCQEKFDQAFKLETHLRSMKWKLLSVKSVTKSVI